MVFHSIDWLVRHTLRSVVFGIVLLALIAIYIAIGSGMASVREYFEMDELAFFNAWPFKVLIVLLIATLVTVTLQRIPFTPPRWGVWMVHTGIVMLVGGTAFYYGNKIEGTALLVQGKSTSRFYDRYERALYFQAGAFVSRVALPALPRFHAYSAELGNVGYLDRGPLKDLSPIIGRADPGGGSPQMVSAAEAVGAKKLTFTVTGYWPYADIRQKLLEDSATRRTGFTFALPDYGDTDARDRLLCAALPQNAKLPYGPMDIEARELASPAELQALTEAARNLHQLTVTVQGIPQTVAVAVGHAYQFAGGITVDVESFDPQWQTIDKQIVPKLTLMIKTPSQTFRRMVLSGLDRPTDFKLAAPGDKAGDKAGDGATPGQQMGPMGKRQKTLLDPALGTTYAFADPQKLLPPGGLGKWIFLSVAGSAKSSLLAVEVNAAPTLQSFDGPTGTFTLAEPLTEEQAMAAAFSSRGQEAQRQTTSLNVTRSDHVAGLSPYLEEVPPQQRNRDEGSSGRKQVVQVRYDGVDAGDQPFTGSLLVPFSEHPFETPWRGGLVPVPNSSAVAQLQLGNNWRPLPAIARLDKLEAVAYGGANPALNAMIRDYRSTITLTDPQSGQSVSDTVFLNSPVFYASNNWIFFQARFDLQNRLSVLGIGNRPGVYTMVVGCVFIIFGIFYAFYVKPMIIKRMKRRALLKAGLVSG